MPTFSSNFFFSSLNWFIRCLRNSLSCKISFSVDASFCSSSSCWEWDTDCSENGVWSAVFSYCGYWERKKQSFKIIGNDYGPREYTSNRKCSCCIIMQLLLKTNYIPSLSCLKNKTEVIKLIFCPSIFILNIFLLILSNASTDKTAKNELKDIENGYAILKKLF